jgi:hypothetical protein
MERQTKVDLLTEKNSSQIAVIVVLSFSNFASILY